MRSPHPLSQKAVTDFAAAASESKSGNRRTLSPLTLRLTPAERERLEVLAAGMTFSAYARACLFAEDARARAERVTDPVNNKKAIAEALALLGQSRIASNLNQLAYHANVGALIEDAETKEQIIEANAHLLAIRTLLMKGLGKRA
ncbi:plasmid mobilization protein [Tateyamaria sp.]|uniref:plasmid mobilization protein n=1 Tax=Tateyamaria sp. TaxID=1929288 RepID=UPI003B219073